MRIPYRRPTRAKRLAESVVILLLCGGIAGGAAAADLGLSTGGEQLKTAPRGWPRDHPRIDLLRRKGLYVMRHHNPGRWLHTAEARELVSSGWRSARPLLDWLDREVGPTTLPMSR